jgi:hypothetical protein
MHERTMFGMYFDLLLGRAKISRIPTPNTFLLPELIHYNSGKQKYSQPSNHRCPAMVPCVA